MLMVKVASQTPLMLKLTRLKKVGERSRLGIDKEKKVDRINQLDRT